MLRIKQKGKKELTMSSRKAIFCMQYDRVKFGMVPREHKVRVAAAFDTSESTVKRIFRKTVLNMRANLEARKPTHHNIERLHQLSLHQLPLSEFPNSVFETDKSNCGRKRKYDREQLMELTANMEHNTRGTYRDHAAGLGVSRMTSWRLVNKEKLFQSVGNNIKPALTAANQYERFQWALSWLDERSMARNVEWINGNPEGDLVYQDMMDVVMIDEKNFFKDKIKRRVILTKDEKLPHRYVRHKSHIEKVMFLCAQARPRYDHSKKCTWDGKIAMIPIGNHTVAQRNSVHYRKGEKKWKNENVDTEVYLRIMEEVVRSIANSWPRGQWNDSKFKVKIQHDGAPAHSSGEFHRGWHMMLGELYVEGPCPPRTRSSCGNSLQTLPIQTFATLDCSTLSSRHSG